MNTSQSQYAYTGLFLLFILVSGFLVSRGGKPYGIAIFTVHKLIGIAAGVYLGVLVYNAHQRAPLAGAEVAVVVVTILLFVGTVIAGGLLSTDEVMPPVVSLIHRIFPYLIVISTIVSVYLLQNRK
jgi:hypothetical protein